MVEASPASLAAIVHGMVQGVAFRDFVWRHARRLGLSGYVRNLPDGASIEVRAEGERAALRELRKLLGIGPPAARVQRVQEEWGPDTGAFSDFAIWP